MLERAIPATGEKLPVIGLGTWQQFDVDSASAAQGPLPEVLERMLQRGGQLIDSSPMYGKAEQTVGDLTASSGNANKYFYATKVWITGETNGIRQMESSMKKMRRTTIDLMQVHNLQDWQTHLKTINAWKEKGRIRYTGITHYTVSAHAELERIVRSKVVDFVQFNYSICVRNAEKSLLNACLESGVAVIINEPFEKGDLFRMVKGRSLPLWAVDYDIYSWTQFFLKYILAHPAINCIIPGTSDPQHMEANMLAGEGRLPDEKGKKMMIEFMESL